MNRIGRRDALLRKYSGCHLIYFSIIKDIKPAARRPTLFFPFSSVLFTFLLAGPDAQPRLLSFSLLFFPRLATAINQKKRFKPPV